MENMKQGHLPQPLSNVTESCLCDWQSAANTAANQQDWVIVVGPLVPLGGTT